MRKKEIALLRLLPVANMGSTGRWMRGNQSGCLEWACLSECTRKIGWVSDWSAPTLFRLWLAKARSLEPLQDTPRIQLQRRRASILDHICMPTLCIKLTKISALASNSFTFDFMTVDGQRICPDWVRKQTRSIWAHNNAAFCQLPHNCLRARFHIKQTPVKYRLTEKDKN